MSSTLREASKDTLQAQDKTYHYYSLPKAARELGDIARLPKSLKVLLENLLRWQDGETVTLEDIQALAGWLEHAHADREIAYRPARVLMQDFTGVPAVVDLAAMREAVKRL
ncbi:aconitase family protein, partial [Cronobacter sakazakii]